MLTELNPETSLLTFNLIQMLVIPKYTSSAQTSPLSSRFHYPTTHSASPFRSLLGVSNLTCPKQNSWLLCTSFPVSSVAHAKKHGVYLWTFFFPPTLYPIYQQQLEGCIFKAQIMTTSHDLFHHHPGHLSPTYPALTVSKLICFWSGPTTAY